jgi:NAD(P)H-hydrate epimerase
MLRLEHEEPSSPAARDRSLLEGRAAALAAAIDAVVVLKGPGTFVVDRASRAHNETGNPGMATAGTGDVLTGIVAALVAQGLAPFDAARLAAWLHGRAGDLAAERVGEISLIATDLLASLPQAIANVQ